MADEPRRQALGEVAAKRVLDFSHANIFQRWRQLIGRALAADA